MSIQDLGGDILNYPEAKCILDYTKERINKKLGMIILFTGEVGSGKSYAGLRFLELWYKLWFNEQFPIKHVCNSIEEAIVLSKDFTRKGEGILVEELSVHAGRRDYQTNQNKLWNKFVDICRIKQIVIIGNCPHISFIDSHFQLMCQVWINCFSVDFDKKVVISRPLWLQTSPHRTEPYKHHFKNDDGYEIDYTYFRKPSEELSQAYDKLKESSNEYIFDNILLKLTYDKVKQLKKIGQKCLTKTEIKAYTLFLNGYPPLEAGKLMGYKGKTPNITFHNQLAIIKKKLKSPEYEQVAKELERKGILTKKLPESTQKEAQVNS